MTIYFIYQLNHLNSFQCNFKIQIERTKVVFAILPDLTFDGLVHVVQTIKKTNKIKCVIFFSKISLSSWNIILLSKLLCQIWTCKPYASGMEFYSEIASPKPLQPRFCLNWTASKPSLPVINSPQQFKMFQPFDHYHYSCAMNDLLIY